MQSTKTKKPNFKRVFWYLFGIIQMISGAANLIEKEEFVEIGRHIYKSAEEALRIVQLCQGSNKFGPHQISN